MKANWYLYTALWATAAVLLPVSVVGVVLGALIGWDGMVWAALFTLVVGVASGFGAFGWKFSDSSDFPLPARPREVKKMQAKAKADPEYIAYLEEKQAKEVKAIEAQRTEEQRAGQRWLDNNDRGW